MLAKFDMSTAARSIVQAIRDEREAYDVKIARLRTALERIAKGDVRQAEVCIHSGPAGNTYAVEEFPGPWAKIALEALQSGSSAA